MYSKFDAIPLEKQQKILNAAMQVFAEEGYEKASTNRIVQEAGISKGLLFHYFQNKKQLYLYLYDYCLNFLMEIFYEKIDYNERDFFAQIDKISRLKMETMIQHPLIFKFVEIAYFDTKLIDIEEVISTKSEQLMTESMSKIFSNTDQSLFKEGIDANMAMQTVLWASEGYIQSLVKSAKANNTPIDYDALATSAQTYLAFLKQTFYK